MAKKKYIEYNIRRYYTSEHPHAGELPYGHFGPYHTMKDAKADALVLLKTQPKNWFHPGFEIIKYIAP
jgi:hypothetical protein